MASNAVAKNSAGDLSDALLAEFTSAKAAHGRGTASSQPWGAITKRVRYGRGSWASASERATNSHITQPAAHTQATALVTSHSDAFIAEV
jgi:hypothetical protein